MALRFLLAVTALYALWIQCGSAYEHSLVRPAGWLLQRHGAGLALAHDGEVVVIGVRTAAGEWRAHALPQPADAYSGLLVALAALAALPALPPRRRLALGAVAAVALWSSHVLVLYGGAWAAVGHLTLQPTAEIWASGALVGMWTAWVAPALVTAGAVLLLPRALWGRS